MKMGDNTYQDCLKELEPTMTVYPRHLPFYSRFESRLEVSAGQVIRVYNPPSLSKLSSVLLVANCAPEKVQR